MPYLIYIFIFIFGLIIGSFLNAVIYRLEKTQNTADIIRNIAEKKKKLSIITGRSICPHCEHILAWYDLVPVFSFIWLRGKCRYCRQKISVQYPLVELATGLLFTAFLEFRILNFEFVSDFGFRISDFLVVFYWLYIISVLIIIFVYDLRHYIIPDKIVLPAIVIAIVWNLGFEILNLFRISDFGFRISYIDFLFAALGASGFFLSIILLSKGRWMGFGDVKLGFLMGLVLGPSKVSVALFTAFVSGAIIGIGLMFFKKKGMKSEIPFGPFLVGGTILSLFFGEMIVNWYLNILT